MKLWFRLGLILLVSILSVVQVVQAQTPTLDVSGRINSTALRVFTKDTVYRINGTLTVAGTLLIEPGTRVEFFPNGRLIDSVGGRIIADGTLSASFNSSITPQSINFAWNYGTLDYYYSPGVITSAVSNDATVSPSKRNLVFNFKVGPTGIVNSNTINPGEYAMTPAQALLFTAARIGGDGFNNSVTYRRGNGNSVNVTPAPITFVGQPVGNFSNEWGHIIILPGSRSAFFRNCVFQNFRKDTTVDRVAIYGQGGTPTALQNLNNAINKETNGVGGAITSFSSRTWLIGCTFRNNFARRKGGAVSLQQALPGIGVYPPVDVVPLGFYEANKNPALTDNQTGQPNAVNASIIRIDNADTTLAEPLTDANRQVVDDARVATFLGRHRNLTFENNEVLLSNYGIQTVGTPPVQVISDLLNQPATFPRAWGDEAYGGAMSIEGRDETRKIEVGLGINNSIRVGNQIRVFATADSLNFRNNRARNLQSNPASLGARGGALYVGNYTNVTLAGRFDNNSTSAPFQSNVNQAFYSLGGAIYAANTQGRLQVRGGREDITGEAREVVSHFTNNTAGAGGAIYIDGNVDKQMSPIIGGFDVATGGLAGILRVREYGRNILFENNTATVHGGAIYTKRNLASVGGGGVVQNINLGYDNNVIYRNNTAGLSGGAISINIPPGTLTQNDRYVQLVRSTFQGNMVSSPTASASDKQLVRGGGAIYSVNADLNLVKGSQFMNNTVYNGNGGAIAMISPNVTGNRYFLSDLDNVTYSLGTRGVATAYQSLDSVFTRLTVTTPDARMLTRFIENQAETNPDPTLMGSGITQLGDVKRVHPGLPLRENGIGLGGAIYVLDSVTTNRNMRVDSIFFNRVRIQGNDAWTGAAIYSDNYNLRLNFARSLVTQNIATSNIGKNQNAVTGPYLVNVVTQQGDTANLNPASSDLAGAVFYGEVIGPVPSFRSFEAGNTIDENQARFIIRLPDAPDSKGTLIGTTGVGFGGVDTLRGNYWGQSEAKVILKQYVYNGLGNIVDSTTQETFFIDFDTTNGATNQLSFIRGATDGTKQTQGPFERAGKVPNWTYTPIPNLNAAWNNQDAVNPVSIPEYILLSGHIYDIFDKNTDIKVADYSRERLSPIEDFAVGIPPRLRLYTDATKPSLGKVIKRLTRDTRYVDSTAKYPFLTTLQTEWASREFDTRYSSQSLGGRLVHPLGYPLYLEAQTNYNWSSINRADITNDDPLYHNESVFFVINVTTGDFIRVNMKQLTEGSEILRGKVDLVPDSTNRSDTRLRLAAEGLSVFPAGINAILSELASAEKEDNGVLQGRKYDADQLNLGTMPASLNGFSPYSNQPSLNLTRQNLPGNRDQVTYFAGQRYGALPVNVGDHIHINSRTILRREGVDSARNKGIDFVITESTPAPRFTGAVDSLTNFIVPEFRKSIFVVEDRDYPEFYDARARNEVLRITARDTNNFWDPRSIMNPSHRARLDYSWSPLGGVNNALSYWLKADTTQNDNVGTYNRANGWVELFGTPINPFVVPGGERLVVGVTNFPPSKFTAEQTIAYDYYNDATATLTKVTNGNDTVARVNANIFRSFFNVPVYDVANSRYLQQDTLNYARNLTSRDTVRIFVIDSIPQFVLRANSIQPATRNFNFSNAGSPLDIEQLSVPATYNIAGDPVSNHRLWIANVADDDILRFQIDVNTNDELEDSLAASGRFSSLDGTQLFWNFPYGRTSYSFASGANSANDLINVDNNVTEVRPNWLANKYNYELVKPDQDQAPTVIDTNLTEFATRGRLNIRVPANETFGLLTPRTSQTLNQNLNLDTLVRIAVNDGHGGINFLTRRIIVNIAPTILTTQLPEAVEDFDYNPTLDSTIRIVAFDHNAGNWGNLDSFRLIYAPETGIRKDEHFWEAGNWDAITSTAKTPAWLKINTRSGVLYGTPTYDAADVNDAPRNVDTVTVLVKDQGGLTHVVNLPLTVRATNHAPEWGDAPVVRCIDTDSLSTYSEEVTIFDKDLNRRIVETETVSFTVVKPAGLTVNPTQVTSQSANFTSSQRVTITAGPGFTLSPGGHDVVILATDADGLVDTLEYKLTVAESIAYGFPITITNNKGATQTLRFGASTNTAATTTGDLFIPNLNDDFGKLDTNHCEYELPPIPNNDVFDARWTLPNINGLLRNVYPVPQTDQQAKEHLFKARFQSGGVTGLNADVFPIRITWSKSAADRANKFIQQAPRNIARRLFIQDRNSQGNIFFVHMADALDSNNRTASIQVQEIGDEITILVTRDEIEGFVISYEPFERFTSVETPRGNETILSVESYPNPFNASTTVNYNVPAGDVAKVQVYDNLGNVVATLANGHHSAGSYSVKWDGTSANGFTVANGTYTIKLTVGAVSTVEQIMFVR
ncbi:MAG: T9SS type A sorting domain-containing protein [Candidatus Kapabacteria bacterium]|nr:T9SS type A sorting domain-containing protein [Candidatus Kapabacteria bacterium]